MAFVCICVCGNVLCVDIGVVGIALDKFATLVYVVAHEQNNVLSEAINVDKHQG